MPKPKLYPGQKIITLNLRLPADLKQLVQERALKNCRSLNQEIIWLLRKAIELLAKEPSQEEK